MVNCVRFMISEEDLALGSGIRVDDLRAQELFVAEFYFTEKGHRMLLT